MVFLLVFFHVLPKLLPIADLSTAKFTIHYILMLLQVFLISKGLATHMTCECIMYKSLVFRQALQSTKVLGTSITSLIRSDMPFIGEFALEL